MYCDDPLPNIAPDSVPVALVIPDPEKDVRQQNPHKHSTHSDMQLLLNHCGSGNLGSSNPKNYLSRFATICREFAQHLMNQENVMHMEMLSFRIGKSKSITMEIIMTKFIPGAEGIWHLNMKRSDDDVETTATALQPASFYLIELLHFYRGIIVKDPNEINLISNSGLVGPYSVIKITFGFNPIEFWLHCSIFLNTETRYVDIYVKYGGNSGSDFGFELDVVPEHFASQRLEFFQNIVGSFVDITFDTRKLLFSTSNIVPLESNIDPYIPAGVSLLVMGSGKIFGFLITELTIVVGSKGYSLLGKTLPLYVPRMLRFADAMDENVGVSFSINALENTNICFQANLKASFYVFRDILMTFFVKEEVIYLKSVNLFNFHGVDVEIAISSLNCVDVMRSAFSLIYLPFSIKNGLIAALHIANERFTHCDHSAGFEMKLSSVTLSAFGHLGDPSTSLMFKVKFVRKVYYFLMNARYFDQICAKILDLIKDDLFSKNCSNDQLN